MSKWTVRNLTLAAVIAALYAALTIGGYGFSYGPVQLRVSEALTVLPFFFPTAIPGLFIGCLTANLISPYGPLDLVFGSLATLLAAFWTSRMKSRWLAPLPPVLCNAVIVGATIAYSETGLGPAFLPAYAFHAATVGLGELVACYVLGLLLLSVLPRIPFFRHMIPEYRLAQTGFRLSHN